MLDDYISVAGLRLRKQARKLMADQNDMERTRCIDDLDVNPTNEQQRANLRRLQRAHKWRSGV